MIRFAHPNALYLLWLLPVLVILGWGEYRWRLKVMRRWASEKLWDASIPYRAPGRILTKRWIQVAAIGLIILAISGPQVGTRLVEIKREGTDLVLAVDVSSSMQAEDITPSRLLKARHEITRLLDRLRGDRVALVPFAGVAFVQVPLTLDYAAVVSVLGALEPGLIPQPGSSLSAAIKQARRAFRQESKAQRIIVLISDGEDHEAGVMEEAKKAAEDGIIIYTVGMATPNGSPIPMKDERGNITGYKKDRQNQTVISRLNDKLLKEIASTTSGEFFLASPTGDEFRTIYRRLTGMDRQEFESRQYTDFEDRFQWLIAFAFLLIVIEEIIPPGRRRRV